MKPVTIYEADDGSRWDTEAEASKRDNRLAEDRGERIPVFDDNLSDCACRAAIEIDDLILGRAERFIHVEAMAEWLEWVQRKDRPCLSERLFFVRLKEQVGLGPRCKLMHEAFDFVAEVVGGLRQILETPEAVEKGRKEWFRSFCLTVSRSASTNDYYRRAGRWGRWRGRDRYSE
jgi:hypothetical protein